MNKGFIFLNRRTFAVIYKKGNNCRKSKEIIGLVEYFFPYIKKRGDIVMNYLCKDSDFDFDLNLDEEIFDLNLDESLFDFDLDFDLDLDLDLDFDFDLYDKRSKSEKE